MQAIWILSYILVYTAEINCKNMIDKKSSGTRLLMTFLDGRSSRKDVTRWSITAQDKDHTCPLIILGRKEEMKEAG